jgi:hypothetical protein
MTPRFLPPLMVLSLLGACGSDGDGDAASNHLTLDARRGSHELTGTVTMPAGFPASRAFLAIKDVSPAFKDSSNLASANAFSTGKVGASGTLTYTIKGVEDGDYLVSVVLDTSGDGEPSEGDLGGYFGGTGEAPAYYGAQAALVTVQGASQGGLDFGIGAVPCKKKYGEACTAHSDCRGTKCQNSSGGTLKDLNAPSCSAASSTCAATDCGSGYLALESGCFGD